MAKNWPAPAPGIYCREPSFVLTFLVVRFQAALLKHFRTHNFIGL